MHPAQTARAELQQAQAAAEAHSQEVAAAREAEQKLAAIPRLQQEVELLQLQVATAQEVQHPTLTPQFAQ